MIKWMKSLYVNKMQISKGKKHDYLGINIDFSVKGKVAVTMVEFLKRIISDFEVMVILIGTVVLSAAEHLYTIRE